MHMSLDGFVEGAGSDMTWFDPHDQEQWDDLFDMLEDVDLFLLGSGMWTGYRNYWKAALKDEGFSDNEIRYAKLAEVTKHVVFSKTMKDAQWENTEINSGDLVHEVKRIKGEPGENIHLVGGAKFASSFIKEDLVDEYRLLINPVILSRGKSFFDDLQNKHALDLTEVKKLNNGVLVVNYRKSYH